MTLQVWLDPIAELVALTAMFRGKRRHKRK
jgi:hypothetical protein